MPGLIGLFFAMNAIIYAGEPDLDLPRKTYHVEYGEGLGELWWNRMARIVGWDCEMDHRAEDSTVIWVEGRGNGYFGMVFACWKELNKESVCEFALACQPAPDVVVLDDKVVWTRENGRYEKGFVEFSYVPSQDRELPRIWMLKKASPATERIYFRREPHYGEKIRLRQKGGAGEPPKLGIFNFPRDIRVVGADPALATSPLEQYNREGVDYWPAPVPTQNYPVCEMEIIDDIIPPVRSSPLFRCLEQRGVDMVMYHGDPLKESIAAIKATEKNLLLCPMLPKPGKSGEYKLCHWVHAVLEGRIHETEEAFITVANEYLKACPKGMVYIWYPEFDSIFGQWAGGIAYSPMKKIPELKSRIEAGGVGAFEAIFEYWRKIAVNLKQRTDPKRVKLMALLDRPGSQAAFYFKCGVDIIENKHIHRQNVNVVVANARGGASAYGKDYGFDNDCWDRYYWFGHSEEEIWQTLLVYLHAGGTHILNEIPVIASGNKALIPGGKALFDHKLSGAGKTWFEFIRYAKCHPALGKQVAPIAVMRGLPDEWNRLAAPSSNYEAAKDGSEVTFQPYFADYNLLNLVFSNYGLFYRTYPDRLATGTPYGPVDMIPWDADFAHLRKYRLVFYLGKSTCMDERQYENLRKYVNDGGVLVMAAGQLRRSDRTFFKKDLADLFGVRIEGDFTLKADPVWDRKRVTWDFPGGTQRYTRLQPVGTQTSVYYRLKNSDPHVVENACGKGKAYLFATEYLTEFDEMTASRLLQSELEKVRPVVFSPDNTWLEYMIQRKEGCVVLPVFNHGNVGFPSGNGRKVGVWKGRVQLDLNRMDAPSGELEVNGVEYQGKESAPYRLKPVGFERDGQILTFKAEVDRFAEFVISGRGQADKAYFGR